MTKKIIISCLCALVLSISGLFVGCRLLKPTVNDIPNIAKVIGIATSQVVDVSTLTEDQLDSINSVIVKISEITPDPTKTCEEVWTPIINTEVTRLVEEGKIKVEVQNLVTTVLTYVAKGMDYVYIKYPEIKTYRDLSIKTINAFIEGFTFKFTSASQTTLQYNADLVDKYEEVYVETLEHFKK